MLTQPAQSLTDLLLGCIAVSCALQLRRTTATRSSRWQAVFWWFGAAALAGAVYHGAIVRWTRPAEVSWAVISVMVVVAVSYLLAATVAEVLGPGRARAFWLLRSIGVLAYVGMAVSGHAGIGAILACESLTMLSVLALWFWAAYRNHPLARSMLLAISASIAAALVKLLHAGLTQEVRLDPASAYHLAQVAGVVLLYLAVSGEAAGADDWARRPRHELAGTR